MKTFSGLAFLCLFLILTPLSSFSQCHPNGVICPNTIQTAVPFLRIITDARSGGMGDVGLAISPDANAINFNASKLALTEKSFGIAASFTPWLRALGVPNVYLAELNTYKKLGKIRTLGLGFRFFSLGNYLPSNVLTSTSPKEFVITLAYAQMLSEHFSLGISPKFIYSGLANGQMINNIEIKPAIAGAADISFTYQNSFSLENLTSDFTLATAITNIATNKISYTNSIYGGFPPCNWGIGAAWNLHLAQAHQLGFALDFNKLLVPTPSMTDDDNNNTPDYLERSIVSGIFNSFNDAPGGAAEELREVTLSFGLEYWFKERFAFRSGIFWEDETKGNRKYVTFGLGVKHQFVNLNFSYLASAFHNDRTPLDNTIRLSLLFDFPAS